MSGRTSNASGLLKLVGVSLAAFALTFSLVPLYRIACEKVFGIRLEQGPGQVAAAAAAKAKRTVTVQFDGGVNSKLPWAFKAEKTRVEVHPGELTEVWFDATNQSAQAIVGNAVPSVAPSAASAFFNKTECFCFTEQVLAGGETRRMPVRFIVDPQLPQGTHTLTLSYTFYANELATRNLALVNPSVDGIAKN